MICLKKRIPIVCNAISLILVLAFAIMVIADYLQYSPVSNSAPFYVWVLVDALFLVLPSIIVFVIGRIVKKKQ